MEYPQRHTIPVYFYALTLLLMIISFKELYAQHQVLMRFDGKQLSLNPIWTRVADMYGEAGSVESAEFSANSRYIVTGSKFDNQIIMWRTSDGFEVWRQEVEQEIERVAWSPDGEFVASASEDFLVRIFKAKDGTFVKQMEHNNGIDGLAWSHNGTYLASGEEYTFDDSGNRQGFLRLFRMPGGELEKELDLGGTINSIDFSNDDKYILAAGEHGKLKIWRVEDMSLVQTFKGDPEIHFISARFSPDNKLVAVGTGTGDIRIWDFETGELLKMFEAVIKLRLLNGHPTAIILYPPVMTLISVSLG